MHINPIVVKKRVQKSFAKVGKDIELATQKYVNKQQKAFNAEIPQVIPKPNNVNGSHIWVG